MKPRRKQPKRFNNTPPRFQHWQFDSKLKHDNTPYEGGNLGPALERARPLSVATSRLIHGDHTLNGRLRSALVGLFDGF